MSSQRPISASFSFLAAHEETLVLLASQAEVLFPTDPVASIGKLRLFAELLAQDAAARVGVFTSRDEAQLDRLRRLRDRGAIAGEAEQAFRAIRKLGNGAVHDNAGDHGAALRALKLAHAQGVWFERSFEKGKAFKAPLLEPPRAPVNASAAQRAEVDHLRAALCALAVHVRAEPSNDLSYGILQRRQAEGYPRAVNKDTR